MHFWWESIPWLWNCCISNHRGETLRPILPHWDFGSRQAGPNYLTLGVRDTAILKAFLGYFGPTDTLIKFSIWLLKDLISVSNSTSSTSRSCPLILLCHFYFAGTYSYVGLHFSASNAKVFSKKKVGDTFFRGLKLLSQCTYLKLRTSKQILGFVSQNYANSEYKHC